MAEVRVLVPVRMVMLLNLPGSGAVGFLAIGLVDGAELVECGLSDRGLPSISPWGIWPSTLTGKSDTN